ncbi:vacuolar membrane protein [Lichtheimia corymbifera JMRC:FSU:9682]|uniref:E3 ubiquitin-protein ligase PEP5 n=1 Tax=Lichtheimia corymbifera JMRC:FSU:9682 TaxID=1263082 RepID=A0A068S1R5_9FUNG|nr:vacuolar membrane protein [Lichtheimia corymbifera JMRC:FSU:9682]
MTAAQWKQFNFFDRQQSFDPSDKTKSPAVFEKPDISVMTSGRGQIALADSTGLVYVCDRSFKTHSFLAYKDGRVTHLKQLKQKNILITEEDGGTPVAKFWDMDSVKYGDSETITPTCIRSIKIQHGAKPYPVTTIAVLENMSQMAIGLASGAVIHIRGDLSKDRTIKQKVIYEGLGFREQTKSTILFIVTTSSIMSYNTTASKPTVTTLDEQGCGLGCAVMSDSQEMVVGRDEAIYFYDSTGRGQCFAYDTPKSSMTWFKSNCLVIVSPPVTTSTQLSSASRSSLPFSPKRNSALSELTKVTIFDTTNKFIAFLGTFVGGIRGVFCEWNSVWIVGTDGKIYHLDEKDTPTKLEILFKLNLYVLAINLAHSQKYDDASIAEIFKKYADHLYSKGDYDGAIDQYIRTIGELEPSYVIRKFLDAQRIYNLTNYLQELHSQGLANADHTTLLLNCYTKLKDVSRLDHFLKTDADLNFDLETAISVCRQAGYYEHAVYLAEKFQEHDLYLDIVIEDMREYDKALAYIRKLSPYEADKSLQKYSKTLLTHLPDQTTEILVELCTGTLSARNTDDQQSPTPSAKNNTSALQTLSILPFATANESASIRSDSSGTNRDTSIDANEKQQHKGSLKYSPPSARIFMPAFVERPNYLVVLLESVYEKRWAHLASGNDKNNNDTASIRSYSTREDKTIHQPNGTSTTGPTLSHQEKEERKAIWNTLLELYLMDEQPFPLSSESSTGSREELSDEERQKRRKNFRVKALALLKDQAVDYDTNQALVLCQLKQFDEGIVYLYEKTGMYSDIVQFWIDKEETDRVIEAVRKYGPKDSSLYPMVLTYFSSNAEVLSKSTPELLSVLNHIDSQDLLPPIQVVQALARSDVASISLIKRYIGKKIEHEREELSQNEELIASYREETEKRRQEIDELQTSARIFQVQKCTGCDGMLDLPAVHFLCRHSYHQRCLGDNDRECPQCAIQHRMISEIRRTQEANADRHDIFFDQLDNEEDGFSVIADYFSKNTMTFAKLID